MSATVLGRRLAVRNSLIAYRATPPASSVETPRNRGPSSARQLPMVSVGWVCLPDSPPQAGGTPTSSRCASPSPLRGWGCPHCIVAGPVTSVTCTTVWAQPWLSSRRRSHGPRRQRSLQAGGVHSAQFFLQVSDLVAEPGGKLELQVPRRGHHLLGEGFDQVGQLCSRHARGVATLEHARAVPPAGRALGPTAARRVAPGSADFDRVAVLGLAVDLVENVGNLLA